MLERESYWIGRSTFSSAKNLENLTPRTSKNSFITWQTQNLDTSTNGQATERLSVTRRVICCLIGL